MPLIAHSSYQPARLFRNGHFATLYAGALQPSVKVAYNRYCLRVPDQDFLEVDYALNSADRAVVLCHGLEGSAKSSYISRVAAHLLAKGYAVFAWNNRSCGTQMNASVRLYHHGETQDLAAVVADVLKRGFQSLHLLGFSMGAAQIVNYLGSQAIDPRVKSAVAVSTPVSLKSSVYRMGRGLSRLYLRRFISKLRLKVMKKAQQYPQYLNVELARSIRNFEDVVRHYIVPIYGFKNVEDFFEKASPSMHIQHVRTPVLILNALDDPIIGAQSYPVDLAKTHPWVYLETPDYGGHCGFPLPRSSPPFPAVRALQFFEDLS